MHVPIDETMKAAVIACMYLLGYNEGCSGVNVTAIIDPAVVQELEERARWP